MASPGPTIGARCLLHMPNEVLRNIASMLKYDLYNFILVSKVCQVTGEPFLYRNQRTTVRIEQADGNHKPTFELLRNLLNDSMQAACIRKFEINECVGSGSQLSAEWLREKDTIFTPEDWLQINQIVQSQWRDHAQSRVLNGLKYGHFAAALVLIFTLTWSLEEIVMSTGRSLPHVLAEYLKHAGRRQHGLESRLDMSSCLPRLAKVTSEYRDDRYGREPNELEEWARLKSMRVLEGDMYDDEGYWRDEHSDFDDGVHEVQLWEENIRTSLVEKLVLGNSALDAHYLADMLRSFPRLKHFEYHFGGATVGMANLEPPKLRRALLEVKDSLEYLKFDDWGSDEVSDLSHYPFGSFKSFPKLKTIDTDFSTLLGTPEYYEDYEPEAEHNYPLNVSLVESLPASIQCLRLSGYELQWMSQLVELARNLTTFPDLREVHLVGFMRARGAFVDDDVIELEQIFEWTKVSLHTDERTVLFS